MSLAWPEAQPVVEWHQFSARVLHRLAWASDDDEEDERELRVERDLRCALDCAAKEPE